MFSACYLIQTAFFLCLDTDKTMEIFKTVNVRVDVCSYSNQIILSCILLSAGTGLLIGWSWILNCMLKIGVALKENTYAEKIWQINPMPLYLDIYAFNWTNPEDLHKPGFKPRLKEVGPFSFKEIKEKGNVTWNANHTVSFRQYHHYYFERARSVYDLDVQITTLNPVLVSAAYTANQRKWGFWMRKGMQMSFTQMKQSLVVSRPFGQYLFEGYYDPMVMLSQRFPLPYIPKSNNGDKFGWFLGRNGTSFEGDFNMGTSYHNFGILEQWNFSNKTHYYTGHCNTVTGESAGELHRPYPPKDSINIFVPDMCRNVPLDFEKEENVEGVIGRKYSAGKRFLDNGTLYPENKCYCYEDCFPSGALNISSCKYGAPGFVSLPHFHQADNYYLDKVDGLVPDREKHDFYITLEPLTGITLKVAARLQISLLIEPTQYLTEFQNIPKVIFPVIWFEEVVQIPNFLLILVKIFLYIPLTIQITGALLMLIGIILLSTVIYKQSSSKRNVDKNKTKYRQDLSTPEKQRRLLNSRTKGELVPLKEKESLIVIYETGVQLVETSCSLEKCKKLKTVGCEK